VFTCSFCPGQVFKKRNDINRHLKKHVPIEMRKRFQCEQCKEKFINNSNLKVHMKVCTGKVKEFLCKKCGDIQHNKTDHLEHLARVHNINKKHGCPICHKQLKKTSDLKKHMATHSNQKPFACQVCGKRFKTESYVKVHMKLHFADGVLPEELAQSMAANAAPSNAAIDECYADNGHNESERYSEGDVPTSEDFSAISAEIPEDNEIPEDSGIPADNGIPAEKGRSNAAMEKEEAPGHQGGDEDQVETPLDTPDHLDTPLDTPDNLDTPVDTPDSMDTPVDTPDNLDTPVDTPEGINTPEGGSTSDEYEQDNVPFGKKDMYVAQMSLFRNTTEMV